jgi:hypothetical protein
MNADCFWMEARRAKSRGSLVQLSVSGSTEKSSHRARAWRAGLYSSGTQYNRYSNQVWVTFKSVPIAARSLPPAGGHGDTSIPASEADGGTQRLAAVERRTQRHTTTYSNALKNQDTRRTCKVEHPHLYATRPWQSAHPHPRRLPSFFRLATLPFINSQITYLRTL